MARAGRRTVTERPSAPRRHSSTSSSAEASWRANTNSGSGRNTDSSVIGTGLFENAPYTIADDTITRCEADAASASARNNPTASVTLSRRLARVSWSPTPSSTIVSK
jgi:hypothetical protein